MSEEQGAAVLAASEETLDSGIFYRHWRHPDARAVALLVHGLGEHSGRYQHVAEALAARRERAATSAASTNFLRHWMRCWKSPSATTASGRVSLSDTAWGA